MSEKKTTFFLSLWDYGEFFYLFILNAWIRAELFLTSLKLREFAPAGTETKSPTLHHARLLWLAGDLACWLHHRSCSAPPTLPFHVENLSYSFSIFIYWEWVVRLVNGGKSEPQRQKTPKHLPDFPVAKHSWNPAEPADHKIALHARLSTCLGPKNAGQQVGTECQRGNRASGAQSPRLDNEFYQSGDLVWAKRDDLARRQQHDEKEAMINLLLLPVESKANPLECAAQDAVSRASAVTQPKMRHHRTNGAVSLLAEEATRACEWVRAHQRLIKAFNFLQLQTSRPITMHVRVGGAQQDCQVLLLTEKTNRNTSFGPLLGCLCSSLSRKGSGLILGCFLSREQSFYCNCSLTPPRTSARTLVLYPVSIPGFIVLLVVNTHSDPLSWLLRQLLLTGRPSRSNLTCLEMKRFSTLWTWHWWPTGEGHARFSGDGCAVILRFTQHC